MAALRLVGGRCDNLTPLGSRGGCLAAPAVAAPAVFLAMRMAAALTTRLRRPGLAAGAGLGTGCCLGLLLLPAPPARSEALPRPSAQQPPLHLRFEGSLQDRLAELRRMEPALRLRWKHDEEGWRKLPARAWPASQPKAEALAELRTAAAAACGERDAAQREVSGSGTRRSGSPVSAERAASGWALLSLDPLRALTAPPCCISAARAAWLRSLSWPPAWSSVGPIRRLAWPSTAGWPRLVTVTAWSAPVRPLPGPTLLGIPSIPPLLCHGMQACMH